MSLLKWFYFNFLFDLHLTLCHLIFRWYLFLFNPKPHLHHFSFETDKKKALNKITTQKAMQNELNVQRRERKKKNHTIASDFKCITIMKMIGSVFYLVENRLLSKNSVFLFEILEIEMRKRKNRGKNTKIWYTLSIVN